MESKVTSGVFIKVLCQKDYLTMICLHLNIFEIFKLIPGLSQFHFNFINCIEQSKLIQTLINYDFPNIFDKLNFKLEYSNDDTSLSDNDHDDNDNDDGDDNSETDAPDTVSEQLASLFCSWDDLVALILESKYKDDKDFNIYDYIGYDKVYRLTYIFDLGMSGIIEYWLPKIFRDWNCKEHGSLKFEFQSASGTIDHFVENPTTLCSALQIDTEEFNGSYNDNPFFHLIIHCAATWDDKIQFERFTKFLIKQATNNDKNTFTLGIGCLQNIAEVAIAREAQISSDLLFHAPRRGYRRTVDDYDDLINSLELNKLYLILKYLNENEHCVVEKIESARSTRNFRYWSVFYYYFAIFKGGRFVPNATMLTNIQQCLSHGEKSETNVHLDSKIIQISNVFKKCLRNLDAILRKSFKFNNEMDEFEKYNKELMSQQSIPSNFNQWQIIHDCIDFSEWKSTKHYS